MRCIYLGAITCLIALVSTAGVTAEAGNPSTGTAQAQCKALARVDFVAVQDAPTHIKHAQLIGAGRGMPAFCQIQGYVAPRVGFELRLPIENWNGKFMQVGCGGWCGASPVDACEAPLARGYACVASDMGHRGRRVDMRWAQNNLQARIDFGYRATHVAALAGKAIAQRYYQAPLRRSYFVGCSTGGYQGLTEAQRFPWDFDGIIAGAPDIDESAASLRATWIARTARDQHGQPILTRKVLQLVHTAVLARCEMDDGVADGVVGNPFKCDFDPKTLICKQGESSGCLSAAEAQAISQLYAGPATFSGDSVVAQGLPKGSELHWTLWLAEGIEQYFKYGIAGYTSGSNWKYTDFDFDRDYKRFGLAGYYDNSNPDLRRFKRAGGKLIVYHGGSDTIDLPGPVIDYYETVTRTLGGRGPTEDFFRLFMVPGMSHCTGGEGAYAIDYLHYLEAWVERGQAPDQLIGAHVNDAYLSAHPTGNEQWAQTPEGKLSIAAAGLKLPLDPAIPVTFRRPIYPYPLTAAYDGTGDPNSESSFRPVEP